MQATKSKVQGGKASKKRHEAKESTRRVGLYPVNGSRRHAEAERPHGGRTSAIGTAGRYPVIDKWELLYNAMTISLGDTYENSEEQLTVDESLEIIDWLYPELKKNKKFNIIGVFGDDHDPRIFLMRIIQEYMAQFHQAQDVYMQLVPEDKKVVLWKSEYQMPDLRMNIDFMFKQSKDKDWLNLRDFLKTMCQIHQTHFGFYMPMDSDHYQGDHLENIQSDMVGPEECGIEIEHYDDKQEGEDAILDFENFYEFINSKEWDSVMVELKESPKPRYMSNLLHKLKKGQTAGFHQGLIPDIIEMIEIIQDLIKRDQPWGIVTAEKSDDSIINDMDYWKLDIRGFGGFRDNKESEESQMDMTILLNQSFALREKPSKAPVAYFMKMWDFSLLFYKIEQLIFKESDYKQLKWTKKTSSKASKPQ